MPRSTKVSVSRASHSRHVAAVIGPPHLPASSALVDAQPSGPARTRTRAVRKASDPPSGRRTGVPTRGAAGTMGAATAYRRAAHGSAGRTVRGGRPTIHPRPRGGPDDRRVGRSERPVRAGGAGADGLSGSTAALTDRYVPACKVRPALLAGIAGAEPARPPEVGATGSAGGRPSWMISVRSAGTFDTTGSSWPLVAGAAASRASASST